MSLLRPIAFLRLGLIALLAGLAGGTAHAQDPILVGNEGGGGVVVDLSVLDSMDRPGDEGGDQLRFPGSNVGPDEAVRLRPPGIPVLKRPVPKTKTVRQAPKQSAPPARPAAEARAAAAPPRVAPIPPGAAPAASAPPRAVTPPPAPELSRSDVPPPPAPSAAMPETPEPPQAAALPPAEVPPVMPAPRTGVGSASLPPEPPPAPIAPPAKATERAPQTAALPPASSRFDVGATRVIAFADGSAAVPAEAAATLKAAAEALNADPALRLEIKAYAKGDKDNASKARRLSLSRALGVRSVLIKEGVQPTRIDVRALGNQIADGPADRVDVTVVAR